MNRNKAIGIFDSGIGGLTVAKAIHSILPDEQLIYFGDTAHLPYGDKSSKAIKHYAEGITNFLLSKSCKIVVIACNTASATAFKEVKNLCEGRSLAFNVIDPVVEEVKAKHDNLHKVGIIGTKRTVNSRVYTKRIKKALPTIETSELATPLLAPMIEEGFFNNKISQTIIDSYLSKHNISDINLLVLACTHYPLIQDEVERFYTSKIPIIDSAGAVARHVKQTLIQLNLLNTAKGKSHEFYVSDFTKSFDASAKIFFGDAIHLEEKNIWT